ncbi:MAG TPA: TIR domain-containing protein [Verrucomicrobiae bacterium]|jgi:HD superfamily phosphohydrolase|nr:TIR domain-containing protein [Verrucomicrobiae bacterium]
MSEPSPQQPTEDFDYFYDSIHGKVNFSDLPNPLHDPLRAILNAQPLTRLTRISQLGYTSINFFSATQTRFSHAVGTLLMMHRLTTHLWGKRGELFPKDAIEELKKVDDQVLKAGNSPAESIISHLLLAALLQDIGELPFQKITSLYLRPHISIFNDLNGDTRLKALTPEYWSSRKSVFTVRGILDIFQMAQLKTFSLKFVVMLIVGNLTPVDNKWLQTLRQMLDGVIDADRLDYVHRDAHLTIGSLSNPDSVLRTIESFDEKGVIVNDPRPVIDFLATRARLWTFVYTAPPVRFRQALLRNILQGFLKEENGRKLLAENGIAQELEWEQFRRLDDHSVLLALRGITSPSTTIPAYAREALTVFRSTISGYECRVVTRNQANDKDSDVPGVGDKGSSKASIDITVPEKAFFDLLYDHDDENDRKLYKAGSVRVKQALMEHCAPPVALELCAGAFSPVFNSGQEVRLVARSFLVFLPDRNRRGVGEFEEIESRMQKDQDALYAALSNEDTRRDLRVPSNTWSEPKSFKEPKIAISCSFKDRVEVQRIVRCLYKKEQRYNVLLDSLLWIGGTSQENSRRLIKEADAVLYVFSDSYLQSWDSRKGNIYAEILEGREKENQNKKVIISLISCDRMKAKVKNWDEFHKGLTNPPIINDGIYLYSDSKLDELVEAVIAWLTS